MGSTMLCLSATRAKSIATATLIIFLFQIKFAAIEIVLNEDLRALNRNTNFTTRLLTVTTEQISWIKTMKFQVTLKGRP